MAEINLKESLKKESFKDTVYSDQKLINTKVYLNRESIMGKENIPGHQETTTKAITKMDKSQVLESIVVSMGRSMRETG